MRVAVPRVAYAELRERAPRETSSAVRSRVVAARARMSSRLTGTSRRSNAEMTKREVERFCALEPSTERMLADAVSSRRMSARGVHRVLRVARTIADLADQERIRHRDLALALLLRGQM